MSRRKEEVRNILFEDSAPWWAAQAGQSGSSPSNKKWVMKMGIKAFENQHKWLMFNMAEEEMPIQRKVV